jgi:hypothetical protein
MTNSKHTPGPWNMGACIIRGAYWFQVQAEKNGYHGRVGSVAITPDRNERNAEDEANARLIAEAGTVATETGLTPRQLAEQRAELLEAAKDALDLIDSLNSSGMGPLISKQELDVFLSLGKAINKAEGRV